MKKMIENIVAKTVITLLSISSFSFLFVIASTIDSGKQKTINAVQYPKIIGILK
jgi:hypothetical protein